MSEKRTIKIRRTAREYLLLKGGVIETKLTESELEQAFRICSERYRMEDIENTLQAAYGAGTITEDVYRKCMNDRSIKRAILEQYDKICSCDIAYNDTLEEAVRKVMEKMDQYAYTKMADHRQQ